jgi:enoyl-CoA hydratase/carnithine racemase
MDRQGPVAVLRMDWPDRHNALGPGAADEVGAALDAASDGRARALVMTGAQALCAEGDLRQFSELVQEPAETVRNSVYGSFQVLFRKLAVLPIPTIAAIDGSAIGLGMNLALACDMRSMGEKGWMRQGWAALGLIPGTGGVLLLRRLAPRLIWRLIAEQPRLGPLEARAFGLAQSAVPGDALSAALSRGQQLASLPTATIAAYVRLQRQGLCEELQAHLLICLEFQIDLLRSGGFVGKRQEILSTGKAR